jgi:hypothetical protein
LKIRKLIPVLDVTREYLDSLMEKIMNIRTALSMRFLLMLSVMLPAVFISTIGGAKAEDVPQSSRTTIAQRKQPFIKDGFRRDTILDLHKSPRLNGSDKGKDSSDKGKDASDKGSDNKEACDNPCGGSFHPGDRVTLPAERLQVPAKINNTRSKSLLKANQPIF